MASELPQGTVTFLFTDIEDSSTKWDLDSTSMEACLATHNLILDRAIADHHGHVVKTMGDGYMAVFARAEHAIEAATSAQKQLLTAEWAGDVGPVKVRMGLHTGNVDLVEGDYFGPDVNRSARIESAGHGGQILISAAAKEMAASLFGSGVNVVDLGRHELRGLSRPEHLYQVVGDGLEEGFPPLRTAEAGLVRSTPNYHTSFVGKAGDLADLEEMVGAGTRLITLVGPGGAGKTRLAVEATRRLAPNFPHGAVFCQLAAVESEDLVVSALIEAVGFAVDTHSSDLDPKVQVLDYLRHRSMLVVFDNFEHLLEAAGFVQDLLTAGEGTSVLVTSRERLHLSDETVFRVTGLDDGTGESSIGLFIERALQVDSDFDPDADPEGIQKVCTALGGSPLGIELAAAWVEVLTPSEIAREMEASLDFLESRERDRDERHRSLRAVFDSSWARLTPNEQASLRRLAVFRGGFERDAALDVASADLRLMSSLVAKSLVRRPRPGRFDLHPLLGQFLEENLASSGELEEITERCARYYTDLLRSERDRLDSSDQAEARDLLRQEVANLRFSLLWLADHGDPHEISGILEAVYLFYLAHSWHEGLELLAELSARAARRSEPGFATGEVSAAIDGISSYLVAWVGDLDRASELADRAIAVLAEERPGIPLVSAWAALGAVSVLRGEQSTGQPLLERALDALDPEGHASLYALLCTTYGWSFYEEGDFERADEVFAEALRAAESTGATLARAYAISKLGLTADAAGDHQRAIDLHHEGREAFVKMGDPAGEAYTLSRLSWTYWRVGDFEKAREYALEGLFGFEQISHRWGTLATLFRLGIAEIGLGELEAAERHFRSLIERSVEFTMPQMGDLYGLIGLAQVAAADGRLEEATRVLSSFRADAETPKPFLDYFVEPGLRRLERLMGRVGFADAVSRGAELGHEEALRLLDA